jgi:hypothetical protein
MPFVDEGHELMRERRQISNDKVDELIVFLTPYIRSLLERVEAEEFTTTQFIEVMHLDPQTELAYQQALVEWGEAPNHAKMVIHGQVIPAAMRASGRVEWVGFAHGEDDPWAVPGLWRLTEG